MSNAHTIVAHRNLVVSVDEIWSVVEDTSRYGEWVTSVAAVLADHGQATIGESYRERVTTVGPLTSEVVWTVREIVPKTLRVDSATGLGPLLDVANVFRFAPIEAGTATSMTYEFHFRLGPRPLGSLVRAVLASAMCRDFDESMRTLESIVLSERGPLLE
ncbi:SRPBCC family protein [Gordonia sp. NPDC003376]